MSCAGRAMPDEYSHSLEMTDRSTTGTAADGPLLALDAGSPVTSVAVGVGDRLLALRSLAIARSSARLLGLVSEALESAGLAARDLAGVVALRGPGSFTGLRVGLATALGLAESLAIPAASATTFDALAALSPAPAGRLVAAVDALRGEWFVRTYRSGEPPRAEGAPDRIPAEALPELAPCTVVGFGVEALAEHLGRRPGLVLRPAEPLAPAALRLAARGAVDRDPARLTSPLYLRAPAARIAGR